MSFEQSREVSVIEPNSPTKPMSQGTTSNRMSGAPQEQPQTPVDPQMRVKLDGVLQSDIGVPTLLTRLKQSISSTRDFAGFLKKRAALEEENAHGVKKLSRTTHEGIRRPDNRQGSFAQNYEEFTQIHERMSDHGLQFANALHQMSDELQDLASTVDKNRKNLKQSGLSAEKRVQDAESAMEKSRVKYYALADQYDRARTGERQSGKFGLKGPKSAAQQEESLHQKVQAADAEYESKVQTAQSQRQELLSMLRPQTIKSLHELITECDSALTMQLQKFATLSEKLILGKALCVTPLKDQLNGVGNTRRGLRDIGMQVNNEKDFQDYVLSFSNKAGSQPPEIKYEKHPALASPKVQQQSNFQPPQPFTSSQPQVGTQNPPQRNMSGSIDQTQSHRPGQPGQVLGVMPYQPSSRDGLPAPGPQPPFPSAAHQKSASYSSPGPQLPQLESAMASGGLGSPYGERRPEVSPVIPSNDFRGPSGSFNQNASMPPNMQQSNRKQSDSIVSPLSAQSPNNNYRPDMIPSMNNNFRPQGPTSGPPPNNPLPNQPPIAPGPVNTGNVRPDMPGSLPKSYNAGMPPGPGNSSNFYQGAGPGAAGVGAVVAGAAGAVAGGVLAQRYNQGTPTIQGNGYQPPPGVPPTGAGTGPGIGAGPGTGPGYRPPGPNIGPSNGMNPNKTPAATSPSYGRRADAGRSSLPPLRPVFGVSLDELFTRDGDAVPHIVYQCIQAVDLFGLDQDGVYRTSGSAPHVMEMKALFDHDSSQVDFRNPAAFHQDIASVTTLLKIFLRDLPDPLLTAARYNELIAGAKESDDTRRRDALHAIINELPDPNYATLRALTLHLARVASHSGKNRMTCNGLAIIFGPTLMGQQGPAGAAGVGADIRDAAWQAKVVETILDNTFQIFDDDE